MQIFLILFMIALAATMWGRGRYRKIYQQEEENTLAANITGASIARRILEKRGIEGVDIIQSRGLLDDFYSPENKRISLSPHHYSGTDFSSLAIASQQAGKAIQHFEGHRPLLWRVTSIRWTVFLSLPLVILAAFALILGMNKTIFPLILLGWSLVAIWNIITIPTELDAGERAKRQLEDLRIFKNLDERVGVERVMGASSTAYIDGFYTLGSWAARTLLPWARKKMGPEEEA